MLKKLLVLGTILTGIVAYGLNTPPTAKESAYLAQKNILINGGVENSTAATTLTTPGWTASAGTMTVPNP